MTKIQITYCSSIHFWYYSYEGREFEVEELDFFNWKLVDVPCRVILKKDSQIIPAPSRSVPVHRLDYEPKGKKD